MENMFSQKQYIELHCLEISVGMRVLLSLDFIIRPCKDKENIKVNIVDMNTMAVLHNFFNSMNANPPPGTCQAVDILTRKCCKCPTIG